MSRTHKSISIPSLILLVDPVLTPLPGDPSLLCLSFAGGIGDDLRGRFNIELIVQLMRDLWGSFFDILKVYEI